MRWAMHYAGALGWPVIPLHTPRAGGCSCRRPDCQAAGKHPRLRAWQTARVSPERVAIWWKRWPDANIGLLTGSPSGLVVLDVDGEEGEAALRGLSRPPTPTVRTGSGGLHLYFRQPAGTVFRNFVRRLPGLDFRGEGGQVVLPPSLHPGGGRYAWVEGLSPDDVDPAPCPEWVLELLRADDERHGPARGVQEWSALIVEGVPEGQRNSATASLAGYLLRRDIAPEVTLALLLAWNRQANRPPLPDEEVARTVRSIARREVMRRGREVG